VKSLGNNVFNTSLDNNFCFNVLIELIKSTPFLTIGKMYGVSDNAVRKWCRYYNLPYRKNDIKEYFK
jgi:hypothetical protein